MAEFVGALVFVGIGMSIDAFVTRMSAKKSIGTTLSWLQGYLLVISRTLVALVGGFAVGNLIRAAIGGDVAPEIEQVVISCIVSVISFVCYWWMMRKTTRKKVPIRQMIKTVFLELWYLFLLAAAFAFVIIIAALIVNQF